MERELQYLKNELANPDRPFLGILGGSKVSDKIAVIKALMENAQAPGIPMGSSRGEADKAHLAEDPES
ncbi:MAG: phosphoglycerate kinase [Verrucomicrobia bacterium]|nr:phosphoglycerate kinase [Verrucomicrobiota bacterium]MBV8378651.1 phosphoglycerate kinase [Verrucomicrobiota bacterium]